jgi:peptidoglycan/LPS O-acetylase OafA/YrhL
MEAKRTYFPGLNSLRFFAAMAVVLTHIELTKKLLFHKCHLWLKTDDWFIGNAWQSIWRQGPPQPIPWQSPFVTFGGYFGVIFFFVLSGFLITYLLLREKEEHQSIDVRKFYVRRILRIWPLYFLLIILGFFVLPHLSWFVIPSQQRLLNDHFWFNLITYSLMVPNFGFAYLMESVPNLGQLWSIGVEEQFYLFWPLFILFSKKHLRNIVLFLVVLTAIKAGAFIYFHFLSPAIKGDADLLQFSTADIFKRLLSTLKFESMALGGIGACIVYYQKSRALQLIYHPFTQIAALLALPAIILFTPTSLYNALYLLLSVPCLIIIMNVGCNESCLYRLRHAWFNYLGKISYGIYMYHLICITFTFQMMDACFDMPYEITWVQNLAIYCISIALTLLTSALSYQYIEKPFIQRKANYAIVQSGEKES